MTGDNIVLAIAVLCGFWLVSALITFAAAVHTSRTYKNAQQDTADDEGSPNYFGGFMTCLFLGPIGLIMLFTERR